MASRAAFMAETGSLASTGPSSRGGGSPERVDRVRSAWRPGRCCVKRFITPMNEMPSYPWMSLRGVQTDHDHGHNNTSVRGCDRGGDADECRLGIGWCPAPM